MLDLWTCFIRYGNFFMVEVGHLKSLYFVLEIETIDSMLIFLLFRYSEICILHFQSN